MVQIGEILARRSGRKEALFTGREGEENTAHTELPMRNVEVTGLGVFIAGAESTVRTISRKAC